MFQEAANWKIVPKNNGFIVKSLGTSHPNLLARVRVELEMRFAKVSIVSYSRPSLMIIVSRTQFHVERPWGQRLFSIVS